MSHTLQPVIFLPHTYVPLSCPQLCGISHTQLPAHCAAVWVPCALGRHCPVPESHLYMTAGVGGGVGGGMMQLAMQVDFVAKVPPAVGAHV